VNQKKELKKILFRADGNSAIGLGHVYRCLAIAERLQENFQCYFAIRQPSIQLKKTISKNATLIKLNQYVDYNDEAHDIVIKIVPVHGIDIIVLDGYYFDTDYQEIIKKNCSSILVSIDDNQPFHYVSDVIINHAGNISEDKISREPRAKLLLGYKYLLLRKEFIELLNKGKNISGICSALICFGGADPENYTKRILDCIKTDKRFKKIVVIAGASYMEREALQNSVKENRHIEIRFNLSASTLARIMHHIDLAIVPASTIALEAFTAKTILITGITASNQQNIYDGLVKEESVIGIDDFSQITCEKLLAEIDKLSQEFDNYVFKVNAEVNDPILDTFNSFV